MTGLTSSIDDGIRSYQGQDQINDDAHIGAGEIARGSGQDAGGEWTWSFDVGSGSNGRCKTCVSTAQQYHFQCASRWSSSTELDDAGEGLALQGAGISLESMEMDE